MLTISKLSSAFTWEVRLLWRFTRRDLSMMVLPVVALGFAGGVHAGLLPSSHALVTIAVGVYAWLAVYSFCLSNQLGSLNEDRLNKPDRPLPSGLVSIRGMRIRLGCVLACFFAMAAWLGVAFWALLWVAAFTLHNYLGGDRRWWTKNLLNGTAGVFLWLAVWQIAAPEEPLPVLWVFLILGSFYLLVTVQDLRDIVGDVADGRRTLPVVLGEHAVRRVLATGFVLLAVAVHLALIEHYGAMLIHLVFDAVLVSGSLIIAARLIHYRGKTADQATYQVYSWWIVLAALVNAAL